MLIGSEDKVKGMEVGDKTVKLGEDGMKRQVELLEFLILMSMQC